MTDKLCKLPTTVKQANWWHSLLGPLLAALLAGSASYFGMAKEVSTMSNSVNRMSATIDKLADKQEAFRDNSYTPLVIKVEKLNAEVSETRNMVLTIKEELRMYHPVRPVRER